MSMKGMKHTEEAKRKIREACKGKVGYWRNKHLSNEHKEKLSKSHIKNGLYKSSTGYICILKKSHPFCDNHGYIRRSRLVMEQHLGRYLTSDETMHHLNGKRDDDRLKNLKLFSGQSAHSKHHYDNSPDYGLRKINDN